MEVAQFVITAVYELVKFVASEVGSIRNLKGKMENLTIRFGELEATESDVQTALTGAESDRRKKRKNEVQNWLNDVAAERTELEELKNDVQQSKPYELRLRRCLAKKIAEKEHDVSNLDQRSKNFGELVLDVEPPIVPLVISTTASPIGNAFQINLGNILKYVMDNTVSSIGIYGMGGVGKTTLATQIHKDLLSDTKFGGCVYWVLASQECTTSELQNRIAKAMKIDILADEDDEMKKAGRLYDELKDKHNFVLIIDDVWKDFNVGKMGIPCGKDACKLIVTSRSAKICREMGCEKVIKVEVLSKAEAWELFQKELKLQPTTPLELSPEATKNAQKIAERCGGLPLGIVVMARSMRGRTDICDWSNAFVELKKSFKEQSEIDEVFPVLLYSFKRLEDPTLRNCFLYCSLYPKDHEIPREELVRKFILEGILEKGNLRKEELDQGNAILNKLEDVSLLVVVTNWKGICIKMHDLVRDMALRITRKNPRFMVKSGLQLKEIPLEHEWIEDLNKVSLMYNKISTIPVGMSPRCPGLTSLNLSNNPLVSIPNSLFEHMRSLQTLDLSRTEIKSLPISISLLVNLKGLLLGYCQNLVSLPSLENLKALRELDLTKTTSFLDEIDGLESLTNLKCLELVGSSMKMMPSGTLRRLSFLQCLNLPWGDCVEVATFESLNRLEEFGGRFADMDVLRHFLKSRNSRSQLISYDIQVGAAFENPPFANTYTKSIIINKVTGEVVLGDDVVLLLRDTKELNVRWDDLSKCILRVREDREQNPNGTPLESLEVLKLRWLYMLRNIIEVGKGGADIIHPPPATFSSLKKLDICSCPKMKKVLPRCFLDNLKNLEELSVYYCLEMEEIIGKENEDEENNMRYDSTTTNHGPTLPKLRILHLSELPELKSIWKSNVNCNSIEEIRIYGCTKLKKVPLFVPHLINGQLSLPPTLQNIYILESEIEWWDSLEWDYPQHKNTFQPFVRREENHHPGHCGIQ